MRFLSGFLLALTLWACPAQAQLTTIGVGGGFGAGSVGCSQATTFLARTSGLSGTETTAYTNMICGMVADGDWAKLDVLYIFATKDTTTALLNLVSTSFTAVSHGGMTFSADHGYTGDGSTGYLDSQYTPSSSGTNYILNSATVGAYILTNRTTDNAYGALGACDTACGSTITQLAGKIPTAHAIAEINDFGSSVFATVSTAQGLTMGTRTGASAETLYKNGVSVATGTTTSSSLPNATLTVFAINDLGAGPAPSSFSADQMSAAFWGSGTISAANISSRINAFMTALGINVY